MEQPASLLVVVRCRFGLNGHGNISELVTLIGPAANAGHHGGTAAIIAAAPA